MPIYNLKALGNNEFKLAGELMASSVLQGGPAPCFLSEAAFQYILDGIDSVSTEKWIHKVQDAKLKWAIDQVRENIFLFSGKSNICETS